MRLNYQPEAECANLNAEISRAGLKPLRCGGGLQFSLEICAAPTACLWPRTCTKTRRALLGDREIHTWSKG